MTDVRPEPSPHRGATDCADRFLAEVRAVHAEREQMRAVLADAKATERFLTACGDDFDPNAWTFKARKEQLPPIDLDWALLLLAGRGWGKTRTLSGVVHLAVRAGIKQINFVGPDYKSYLDTNVDGHSGILATCGRDERPRWVSTRRRLEWSNGARVCFYSADTPESLRGPSCELLLIDELCRMPYAQQVFDLGWAGCRLGDRPRLICATTPRPIGLLKKLIAMPGVSIVRGSTFDNAENLPAEWLDQLKRDYEDTQDGRQELYGQLILHPREAMFLQEWFIYEDVPEAMIEMVSVGVDPAFGGEAGDECGIVAVALLTDGRYAVLGDYTVTGHPGVWADRVVAVHDRFRDGVADITIESNAGGVMIRETIRSAAREKHLRGERPQEDEPIIKEVHSTVGKAVRASPVSLLYEKRKVIHAQGLHDLEEELLAFDRVEQKAHGRSPNRMDALVHALRRLTFKQVIIA